MSLVEENCVHVACRGHEVSVGVEREAVHTDLICSHLHPFTLRSNCPSPAVRAKFLPTSLLPDSQMLLPVKTTCREQGNQNPQNSETGHIPINPADIQPSEFFKTLLATTDKYFRKPDYLHRPLEIPRCIR